jgi:hypothetical protein
VGRPAGGFARLGRLNGAIIPLLPSAGPGTAIDKGNLSAPCPSVAKVWRGGLADGPPACKLLVWSHDFESPFDSQVVREFDETAAQVMTYQAVTDQKINKHHHWQA